MDRAGARVLLSGSWLEIHHPTTVRLRMYGKLLMVLSAVLIVGTIGWWIRDSIDYGKLLVLSKTAREVVIIERDPLFGQEIKRLELQPGRWLGLFDAAPPYGAVPMCVVWLLLGGFGWWLRKRTT